MARASLRSARPAVRLVASRLLATARCRTLELVAPLGDDFSMTSPEIRRSPCSPFAPDVIGGGYRPGGILARRDASPASKGAREAADVGEAEREGDLGDRPALLAQIGDRQIAARLRYDVGERGLFLREPALQGAQTDAELARHARLRRLAVDEMIEDDAADTLRQVLRIDLQEGARHDVVAVARQLRVSTRQRRLDELAAELEHVARCGERHRGTEELAIGLRGRRLRTLQRDAQRPYRAIGVEGADGAHLERHDRIDGLVLEARRRRDVEEEAVAVARVVEPVLRRIADDAAVAHEPMKRVLHRGAGEHRDTEGVEGREGEEARGEDAESRVAGLFHREAPEAPGGADGRTHIGAGDGFQRNAGAFGQGSAVERTRLEGLDDG